MSNVKCEMSNLPELTLDTAGVRYKTLTIFFLVPASIVSKEKADIFLLEVTNFFIIIATTS